MALRITRSTSAQRAKSYFKQSLKIEDAENYYTAGQEVVGQWGGTGAERLGLGGQVLDQQFFDLCDNLDPATGERLTARTKTNRRVGYDFTFSVPKSVSVHQALLDHPEIETAFEGALADTMKAMEQQMNTRVRREGAWADRNTGNMIWAGFTHYTARPVEGQRPDAHLHKHVFVFNATFDEAEGRWKAGEFNELHLKRPYWEAVFHSRLAENIRGLGYEVERNGRDFEMRGYTRTIRDKFSHRTKQIEAEAKRRGVINAARKAELGARTRAGKDKETSADVLREDWRDRLTGAETALVYEIEGSRGERQGNGEEIRAWCAGALEYAIGESFERRSVVKRHEFLTSILKAGMDRITVEQAHATFEEAAARGQLIVADWEGEACVTTPQVQAEEKRMLSYVRESQGLCQPFLENSEALPSSRNGQARPADWDHAARFILSSRDRVTMLVGRPGAGKTTVMQTVEDALSLRGQSILAFAPTAVASRENLVKAGFDGAETLALLFNNKDLQAAVEGQTILVDEAGLMGARETCRLFEIAEARNARVILAGDPNQHKPVARGDAMRVLEDFGQLEPARLNTIRRQTEEEYRRAATEIAEGKIADGFDRLIDMDAISEIEDWEEEGNRRLASDYAELQDAGKTVLVVSPTHAERHRANVAIRAALQLRGAIHGDHERPFIRWETKGFAEWQKADWVHYEEGHKIRFHKAAPGFAAGSIATVVGIADEEVVVAKEGGEEIALPFDHADRFDVFQESEINLARGDSIRITRNGFAKSLDPSGRKQRLSNGTHYTVESFTPSGDIRLTNGFIVDSKYANLDHGYAVTSHASQSLGTDVVLVTQPEAAFAASNAEQFLVSVTRGREAVRIYTDDRAGLEEAVQRSASRVSATELLGDQTADTSELEEVSRRSRVRDWVLHLVHLYQEWTQREEGEQVDRRTSELEQSRRSEISGREHERG